jgi:hypothetical protein
MIVHEAVRLHFPLTKSNAIDMRGAHRHNLLSHALPKRQNEMRMACAFHFPRFSRAKMTCAARAQIQPIFSHTPRAHKHDMRYQALNFIQASTKTAQTNPSLRNTIADLTYR